MHVAVLLHAFPISACQRRMFLHLLVLFDQIQVVYFFFFPLKLCTTYKAAEPIKWGFPVVELYLKCLDIETILKRGKDLQIML